MVRFLSLRVGSLILLFTLAGMNGAWAKRQVQLPSSPVTVIGSEDLEVNVITSPEELLKLLPSVAPALPGTAPNNAPEILATTYLYGWDHYWNSVGDTAGYPRDERYQPGNIINTYYYNYVGNAYGSQTYQLAGEMVDWCDFGTGIGPTLNLFGTDNRDQEQWEPLPFDPLLDARLRLGGLWWDLGGIQFPVDDDKEDTGAWLDEAFGPKLEAPVESAQASPLQPSRQELQTRASNLEARMARYETINTDLQRQLREAREKGDTNEIARLQRLIQEVKDSQDAIHAQTTPIYEALNEMDRPQQEARTQRRNELSVQVNQMAREAIEERIGWDESTQTAKKIVTTGTRWVSLGSEMQYQTDRTTRIADRELAAAEEKLKAINTLLGQAQPGSLDAEILESMKTRYEGQARGARQMLDDNADLTKAGYATDVLLYASGAVLVNAGRAGVTQIASRTLAPQVAERVVANTTQRGIIELGASALGRGGSQQVAAHAGEQAVAQGGGRAASQAGSHAAQEGGEWALGSSSSEFFTGTWNIPSGVLKEEIALAGERAAADQAYREALEAAGQRMRNGESLGQIVDDIVGKDVLPPPNTQEARSIGEALDAAGKQGQEAWRRRQAQVGSEAVNQQAAEAARRQAMERARQIMQERWGGEGAARQAAGQGAGGAGGASTTQMSAPGFRAASGLDPFGKTTVIWGSLPFFLAGLMQQEAYAGEPVQAKADGNGNARFLLPVGEGQSGRINIRLRGTGPQDSVNIDVRGDGGDWKLKLGYQYQVTDSLRIGRSSFSTYLFPDSMAERFGSSLKDLGLSYENNACRDKKFGPLDEWGKPPAEAKQAVPYARSTLRLTQ